MTIPESAYANMRTLIGIRLSAECVIPLDVKSMTG